MKNKKRTTMKKTINLTNIYITTLIMLLWTTGGCKKPEKIENRHEDAYGDVILKKMMMNNQIKYVPIFFADGEGITTQGNTVTAPDGTVYDLHDIPWMPGNKLTGKGQMSNNLPPTGTYTFRLNFEDGSTIEVTDELENTEIDLPVIVQFNYQPGDPTIHIEWQPVNGADFYCIKITELDMANTKPFYKQPQIDANTTSLTIPLDGSNFWLRPVSELQSGTEYFIVVAAKKVEAGTPVSGDSNNMQTSSCMKRKFVY